MTQPNAAPLDAPDIDRVWLDAAARCGFRVERTGAAYATTDGRGVIGIGERAVLDADDCLAQLILHELCHALVQGEARWSEADWGLDNTTDEDDVAEAACLRLQAHLSDRHGLRELFAPTTPWKTYYRALPPDTLRPATATEGEADACELARTALALATTKGMDRIFDEALAATAGLLTARGGFAAITAVHPVGFALGPSNKRCGDCAWIYRGGRGPAVERCRQTAGEIGDGRRTSAEFPACERFEAPVDCLTCGACCREAYHSVSVSMRDPVVWKQPGLMVRDGHRWSVLRSGDRCAALESEPVSPANDGGESAVPTLAKAASSRFHCRIYEDRPRTCREFEQGGRHCLVARRRVGLSP
ncbi:MAG TPA: YkgJ family cysteine cluster protein [Polyangia bacterium]